jgi:hypothetical protein
MGDDERREKASRHEEQRLCLAKVVYRVTVDVFQEAA